MFIAVLHLEEILMECHGREYDKAEWFSNRFGEGYVLEGTVNKKDALAFFNRRGEEEIVIEAKNVQNKQKI